jgi:nucleoside-diphosphate-sugar epimerase/predicted dehydrogenase
VAEHHARFIVESPLASLVGLADPNRAAAERIGARFGVTNLHTSIESLLDASDLDVVHVATPPATHFADAMTCIGRRVNVLVEKPVALTSAEVEQLYKRATDNHVSLCPDFIQLFHPKMEQAIALVNSGALGRPVHVETYLGIDGDISTLRELATLHWSWTLPGGILHNSVTHPVYLALLFAGEPQELSVASSSHGVLPQCVTDHLTVLIKGTKCTATVVLSMAIKPRRYYLQLFCESGVVVVDFETMNITVRHASNGFRAVSRITADAVVASQLLRGTVETISGYLWKRVRPYQGLQRLLTLYYGALIDGREAPVSPALAIATTRTEEKIFAAAGRVHLDSSNQRPRKPTAAQSDTVLVTGATGYLGREVCRQLVERGIHVRALVRPLSTLAPLQSLGVELVFGDVRDSNTVRRVAEGVTSIIHLAASLRGSPDAIRSSCVDGTQNIASAAQAASCDRVIYVSSMSIYDFAAFRNGQRITEESPLEPFPEQRGNAAEGKCRAERIALAHLSDSSPSWTILRPSFIVGNGRDLFQAVGFRVGSSLVAMGSPRKNLRLIHVSDVASAICTALTHKATTGRVFNVSDGNPLTVADYVAVCFPNNSVRVIYMPYSIVRTGIGLLRMVHKFTRRSPNVSVRRLRYLFDNSVADSLAFSNVTGWRSRGNLLQRLVTESDAAAGRKPEYIPWV